MEETVAKATQNVTIRYNPEGKAVTLVHIQGGAKRTHVFQILVTLFIFNIKKLCQHQNNL